MRGRKSRVDSQYAPKAAEMSARLRAMREGAGITQERLAAQAGLSVATVRKIETGMVVEPGYFTVMAMLSALGASPQDLQA